MEEIISTGSYNGEDFTTVLSFISLFTIELASEPVIGESVHGTDPTGARCTLDFGVSS
jgi:hypothetical protein